MATPIPDPVPLTRSTNDEHYQLYLRFNQLVESVKKVLEGLVGLFIRRINQAVEPANGTGLTQIDVSELAIWRDTDNGKIYLIYNDTTSGIKKVELT